MPSSSPETPPSKRVRLTPWRGPVHFLLLLVTSGLSLTLPLLYIALLFVLACLLGVLGFEWSQRLAEAGFHPREILPGAGLGAGLITWLFMLRPLLPRAKTLRTALQATPASQPGLFELVDDLCWHLRLDPPQEIWLDTTVSIRSSLKNGIAGIASGDLVLHIGLPLVSVVSARELAALLVHALAVHSGGPGTTFSHVIQELSTWFYRALHERDPWEMALRTTPEKETHLRKGLRLATRLWIGAAKLPFAILVLLARLLCAPAHHRLASGAGCAAVNLIGAGPWAALRGKMALLDQAWAASRTEIRRGMAQNRLPDNLALLVARHVARAAREIQTPAPAPPAAPPRGEDLVRHLPADAPAASRLRGFVDLARQVTCFYYQHELGISIHEHRLVADEEVLHQNRREDESLVTIRRYFGGLAHPERSMCGLGATHAVSPGRPVLQDEILRVRDELKEWGAQLKMTLKEWNIAWQRRRDLEAAATLSLAGFTVSRIQFGTEDTTPQSLRAEAARQRMIMEHLESTLQTWERKLESRFAAALGLLWWSAPHELDARLLERRRELPGWVSIYEAMAPALPAFRELLTTFFAFQTLGARFSSPEDPGAFFTALQSVVPKMTGLVRQILGTMDGAPHPFPPGKKPATLNDYLLQGKLPEGANISMNPGAAVDMKALSAQMASQSSEVIAPFVDRFLNLYHQSFAWLAECAEKTEHHFLGPLSMGADIELLMPEEFAKMRDTQPLVK